MLPALLLLLTDVNLQHVKPAAPLPISRAALEAALRPGSSAVFLYEQNGALKAASSLDVVCGTSCTGTVGVPVILCVRLPTTAWECVDLRSWLGRN